jgi:hypothetical protein
VLRKHVAYVARAIPTSPDDVGFSGEQREIRASITEKQSLQENHKMKPTIVFED